MAKLKGSLDLPILGPVEVKTVSCKCGNPIPDDLQMKIDINITREIKSLIKVRKDYLNPVSLAIPPKNEPKEEKKSCHDAQLIKSM